MNLIMATPAGKLQVEVTNQQTTHARPSGGSFTMPYRGKARLCKPKDLSWEDVAPVTELLGFAPGTKFYSTIGDWGHHAQSRHRLGQTITIRRPRPCSDDRCKCSCHI